METVLLASTAALLAAVAWPIASSSLVGDGAPEPSQIEVGNEPIQPVAQPHVAAGDGPVIQLALLLDTSSSMDGLIDQARTQLWSVVNTLDGATYHGGRPQLEIALYEYGNDGLDGENGYIRQVSPFTSELDTISQALFALTTNGGEEYAGQVIARSVDDLAWRDGEGVLRVAYIAGNEGFDQGRLRYDEALSKARAKGVVVNTVYCGGGDENDAIGWREGARLAGGKFLSIDQDHVVQHIAAPQDDEIARIGRDINDTYVYFGAEGRAGFDNQVAQDDNMAKYGAGSVVTRSISKGSHMYRNDSWDLVDALESETVELEGVDKGTLPAGLRDLGDGDLREELKAKKTERKQLQSRLAELAQEREEYVARERARLSADDPESLDGAILESIREQAAAAGFTLDQA
jgi:hypothetical protein